MAEGRRERIGFIGLGIMGRPMVRNLVAAGFGVTVHNRSRADVDELVRGNDRVSAATSPAEVATASDIVITMLPDTPDLDLVMGGEGDRDGIAGAVRSGHLVIDMSTVAPAAAIRWASALAGRGAAFIDAPVSGGERGAIDGTLSIMAGGDVADVDRARPVLAAMGRTIVHVGGHGAGQTVKMCNQIAVAVNLAGVSEALVLGARAGVDPARIVEVLAGGLAGSRVLDLKGPAMIDHAFTPGFRVELHRKDLRIARVAASEHNVALPVSAVVTELFESLAANGHDRDDHSALVTAIEALSGFRIGSGDAPTD